MCCVCVCVCVPYCDDCEADICVTQDFDHSLVGGLYDKPIGYGVSCEGRGLHSPSGGRGILYFLTFYVTARCYQMRTIPTWRKSGTNLKI